MCARGTTLSAVALCLGAGLLMAWLFSLLCFEGAIFNNMGEPDANKHDPFFIICTLIITVCGALAWKFPACQRIADIPLSCQAGIVGVTACAALTTLALCFGTSLPRWVGIPCGAVTGLAFFVLVRGWFSLYAAHDMRSVGLLFFGMTFVTLSSLWLFFLSLCLLGACVFVLSLPVLFLLGSCGAYRLQPQPSIGYDTTSQAACADGQDPLVLKASAFAFAANLASMFAWICIVKVYEEDFLKEVITAGMAHWSYLASGLVVVAMSLAMWLATRRSGFMMVVFHRVVLLIIVISFAMLLVGARWFFATYTVSHVAFFLTQDGVWIVLLRAAYLFDEPPLKNIPLILAAQYFGVALAFVLYLALEAFFPGFDPAAVLLTLLLLGCSVFLFVFTEADVKMVDKVSVADPGDLLEAKCASVQKRYGLTKRETDVLALLARGKNAVTAQEELGLSYGTIKTHKQALYGKLGVHSQQELITFMEGVRVR